MVLIGGAALGIQRQAGARTGSLGRWSALAAGGGPFALIALMVIALVSTAGDMATPPPAVVIGLSLVAFLLWAVGSVGFAFSLIRAKAISATAGWLIILGAGVGSVALFGSGASGKDPSPLFFLPLALYGVGWMLVGLGTRTATVSGLDVAGQPT